MRNNATKIICVRTQFTKFRDPYTSIQSGLVFFITTQYTQNLRKPRSSYSSSKGQGVLRYTKFNTKNCAYSNITPAIVYQIRVTVSSFNYFLSEDYNEIDQFFSAENKNSLRYFRERGCTTSRTKIFGSYSIRVLFPLFIRPDTSPRYRTYARFTVYCTRLLLLPFEKKRKDPPHAYLFLLDVFNILHLRWTEVEEEH